MKPLTFLCMAMICCNQVKNFPSVPQHGKKVIMFESCRDTLVAIRRTDTIILKVKTYLSHGGYNLQIDTMDIDRSKMHITYNPDKKVYEESTAVLQQYTIIPLDTGICQLQVVYKRPWENNPLQRCKLRFIIQ